MFLRSTLAASENAVSRLVSRHRFVHSTGIQFPRLSLSRSSTHVNCVRRDASPSFLRRNLTTGKPVKEAVAKEASTSTKKESGSFLERFLGPKEMPPRWTFSWYREMVLLCTVFAITGSSTMVLVRPAVSSGLGLNGSLKEGPWSYRICSLVIMTPIYATLLVAVGTVFGRHQYFRHFSVKMWSRFGIPPEMLDKTFHETKKTFRKY